MIRRQTIEAIQDEANRAAQKHGVPQTPANPHMPSVDKLAIVVEEIGEVARLLTYDHVHTHNINDLKGELVQIAAMCGMWIDSLDDQTG